MEYYLITDLKRIGRIDNFVPYIYDEQKGWIVDSNNLLMDRIMGYDGESIGSSSGLFNVKEISEEEALKIINNNK